jgi:hypothetical protein
VNGSYDVWKSSAPDDSIDLQPLPCPVCSGDMDAEPCGEDCEAIIDKAQRRNHLAAIKVSIGRVMFWARTYYDTRGKDDRSFTDCMARVRFLRDQQAALRNGTNWIVASGYDQYTEQAWIKGRWYTVRTFHKQAKAVGT